jgi:hypothetical protein
MCDLYIIGIGCICSDCGEEFKKKYSGGSDFNEISESLKTFMESSKPEYTYRSSEEDVQDFFDSWRII